MTLADVEGDALDAFAPRGVDFAWLVGVWETGPIARALAQTDQDLRGAYDRALPGWTDDDILASPYAVADYTVAPDLGGDTALAILRQRLRERGCRLVLDFVPNHVGRDHAWVTDRPELFVQRPVGTEYDGFRVGDTWIACGRDPFFAPWRDTAQIDYRSSGARDMMLAALRSIAQRCDGVRCDMAMLVLSDQFERTWSAWPRPADASGDEFWPNAIATVREDTRHRGDRDGFLFLAESYWDLEYRLQTLGFDFTYDKRLYDHLARFDVDFLRGHLGADWSFARRCARFVENHDEERAATVWPSPVTAAATVSALTLPGARLINDGQIEGRRIRSPVQLGRWQDEAPDDGIGRVIRAILGARDVLTGDWTCINVEAPAFAWSWDVGMRGRSLIVVNLSDGRLARRIRLPETGIAGRSIHLIDRLASRDIVCDGDTAAGDGIVLDLNPWQASLFEIV